MANQSVLIWLWAFVKTLYFFRFSEFFKAIVAVSIFPKKPAQISLKAFFKFILSFIRVSLENSCSTLKLKWKGTLFQYCRNWITLRLCPFPCSNKTIFRMNQLCPSYSHNSCFLFRLFIWNALSFFVCLFTISLFGLFSSSSWSFLSSSPFPPFSIYTRFCS